MISVVGEAPGNEIVRKPGCFAGQIPAKDIRNFARESTRMNTNQKSER